MGVSIIIIVELSILSFSRREDRERESVVLSVQDKCKIVPKRT
jgi:hypothetical protein